MPPVGEADATVARESEKGKKGRSKWREEGRVRNGGKKVVLNWDRQTNGKLLDLSGRRCILIGGCSSGRHTLPAAIDIDEKMMVIKNVD